LYFIPKVIIFFYQNAFLSRGTLLAKPKVLKLLYYHLIIY